MSDVSNRYRVGLNNDWLSSRVQVSQETTPGSLPGVLSICSVQASYIESDISNRYDWT